LLNQRVCKLTSDAKKLCQDYLYHFLPPALKAIEDRTPFATVKHLSSKDIREILIPLPPLSEQRRIAAILDKADALCRKRRRALELLDGLPQSIFLDMFGDLVESNDYPTVPLDAVISEIDSGWSPTCLDRQAVDGEFGVLKLSAVTNGEFVPFENKALPSNLNPKPNTEVKAGDILLCRKNTRELVGSSVYVWETSSRLLMSDLIFRLVPRQNEINSIFLQAQMSIPTQRRKISEMSGGAAGSMPTCQSLDCAS
jgi:type I restriction enzyme, S subunit